MKASSACLAALVSAASWVKRENRERLAFLVRPAQREKKELLEDKDQWAFLAIKEDSAILAISGFTEKLGLLDHQASWADLVIVVTEA